jgi:hypothetical protein
MIIWLPRKFLDIACDDGSEVERISHGRRPMRGVNAPTYAIRTSFISIKQVVSSTSTSSSSHIKEAASWGTHMKHSTLLSITWTKTLM